jgi:nucleotide-binding universal stress UspA family protein
MVYVMKEIIAAVDFSDVSMPVLETAVKITQALGGQLHLVHVVEAEPTYAAYGFSPDDYPALHEIQVESSSRAQIKLSKMAEQSGLTGVQTKVVQGQPLHALLQYAKEVGGEMLVLGSHGHGFLSSLLLGSVAEGCVRKAELPALIVPMKQSDDS